MYFLKTVNGKPATLYQYFECDTEEDMNLIPKSRLSIGDECLVIHSGLRYVWSTTEGWVIKEARPCIS